MITDTIRMDAYERALRRAVQPGSVVVDIGAGTGIFTLLACKFGAERVYAIEPNDAIALVAESAAANGFSDRVTCFQKLSSEVELPEKVDVIVSDMRGVLPLLQAHIPSIADARKRFLKPGGIQIPTLDRIMAAPVENPTQYGKFKEPWKRERYDLDMSAAHNIVVNAWIGTRLKTDQFLAVPCQWSEVDYTSVEHPNFANTLTWNVERSGTMHGIGMWFETTLLDDVTFSSLNDENEQVYGHALVPFPSEVPVERGDRITVALRADLTADDYHWTWRTSVFSPGDAHTPRVRFKQSTLQSIPLSRANLRRRAMNYVPALNDDGRIASLTLSLMGEAKTMEEIARHVQSRYPNRFRDVQQAFSHVVKLVERFGERE